MTLSLPSRLATFALVLAGALCSAVPAHAAPLKTEPASSTVSATFKEMGVTVTAPFKKYAVAIDYDAAKVQTASARVEVEVASLDLGTAEMNQEVAKKEWFNAAQFPKAIFVSSSIKPGANGTLTVTGKLSIKGKTQEISFPVTVKKNGAKTVFDGALPIKRLFFNIGEGEWKDTATVADEVAIKFHVTAQ